MSEVDYIVRLWVGTGLAILLIFVVLILIVRFPPKD